MSFYKFEFALVVRPFGKRDDVTARAGINACTEHEARRGVVQLVLGQFDQIREVRLVSQIEVINNEGDEQP